MLNILWAEHSTQFLNHHLKPTISNIWISRVFCWYLLAKEMFSTLKIVQGVKLQQLISDAMKLQNQEHNPKAAIFTSLHMNVVLFLKLFSFQSFKGPGCSYDTQTSTNHCVPYIIFLLLLIAEAQTFSVSPENQSKERYTVHRDLLFQTAGLPTHSLVF